MEGVGEVIKGDLVQSCFGDLMVCERFGCFHL